MKEEHFKNELQVKQYETKCILPGNFRTVHFKFLDYFQSFDFLGSVLPWLEEGKHAIPENERWMFLRYLLLFQVPEEIILEFQISDKKRSVKIYYHFQWGKIYFLHWEDF